MRRFLALATDYDGTLATDGRVGISTITALEKLRAAGCKLVMATGRELDELLGIFPEIDLFDRVIAENGAVMYRPADASEKVLAEKPPPAFVDALRQRGVERISVGRVIVATWEPHQGTVLEVIREQGLDLHVIFNKGAVMILPTSVNKATGLAVALEELGLSPHNTVGVGDAENDHAFLAACGCSAAVGNSLPTLLERADVRLREARGAGVEELIGGMLADDLAAIRREIDFQNIRIPAHGKKVLIRDAALARELLAKLTESKYQYLMLDTEGTFAGQTDALVLHAPAESDVVEALSRPQASVVASLLGVSEGERASFVPSLIAQLEDMRARTGRPHCIVLDADVANVDGVLEIPKSVKYGEVTATNDAV